MELNKIFWNHKGYFFILDGVIALIVLITGIIIIGSVFVTQPVYQPPYNYGEDLLRVMSSSNISNIQTQSHLGIAALFKTQIPGSAPSKLKINDNASTILQQVAKFYYYYCTNTYPLYTSTITDANTTVYETINQIIPKPFYAELKMSGHVGCTVQPLRIYTSHLPDSDAAVIASQNKAKIIMSTQKVIFGNADSGTLFGPYIATMTLWR
jgi:hypothetical protein